MRSAPTPRPLHALLLAALACGDNHGASASQAADSIPFIPTFDELPTTGEPTTSTGGATGTEESDGSGSGSGGMNQCGGCPFTRPNILFVLDYSSTMNRAWDSGETYYEHVRTALIDFLTLEVDLAQRMNFALMHYAHDPDPQSPGTMIAVDTSGLIDGQKLDFPWTVGGLYVPCQNDELADDLVSLIPPAGGQMFGLATWTKGALDFALAMIQQQRAELGEPQDGAPYYRIVLITDGQWTSADGLAVLSPPADDPVLTADLLRAANVKTYVIGVGDAVNTAFADEVAAAGGTVQAYDTMESASLPALFTTVFATIDAEPGITPENCHG